MLRIRRAGLSPAAHTARLPLQKRTNPEHIIDPIEYIEVVKLLVASGATQNIFNIDIKQLEEEITKSPKAAEATREKCHITNWDIPFHDCLMSLHGTSWNPYGDILLHYDPDCIYFKSLFYDNIDTVNKKIDPKIQSEITPKLLKCAENIYNDKLQKVAKECDGKWF